MKLNEKIGSCIKERGNWGKLKPEFRFDNKLFDTKAFLKDLHQASPKLETLLNKIQELDAKDIAEHGKLFKHFIYSDIKSAYGAKLIAAGLSAYGFDHAYKLQKTARGMSFALDKNAIGNKNTFATLTSTTFFEKPIGIQFRKELLSVFNSRPNNIHGDQIRVIVLDSGFREGIDLFDIKYVHLFEPIATNSDQKQAIGRATRFCGQKGLRFDPLVGWPIQVYRYETIVPEEIKRFIVNQDPTLEPADTFFQLFMKFSNIDPKKIEFANELEQVATAVAVDRALTQNVHQFKIQPPSSKTLGGSSLGKRFERFQATIEKKYQKYTWPPVKIENLCGGAGGDGSIVSFSPSQDFVRHYFTPKYPNPGMLLYFSVGTGKTCSAIATASSSFEAEDYTILYITRYTLKGDVWKNMFGQVCNVLLQEKLAKGLKLPDSQAGRLRLISKGWFEPMSYRQFSNMLAGKNKLTQELIARNGKKDPLHKTLIIIDEAHKLFAADVEGQEKADIEVIRKALAHSNEVSKQEGAKLLLMTGTPYTDDPMDMIRLLNLCRPNDDKIPETFETFATEFLDEQGRFTEEGRLKFLDKYTGYISYLNREKDVRSFSYPIFHEVPVAMSDYEYIDLTHTYLQLKLKYESRLDDLHKNKALAAQELALLRKRLEQDLIELMKKRKEDYNQCLAELKMSQTAILNRIKNEYQANVKECKTDIKLEQRQIRQEYKEQMKDIRQTLRGMVKDKELAKEEKQELRARAKKEIDALKLEQEYDVEQVANQPEHTSCLKDALDEYEKSIQQMKIPRTKEECDAIKEENVIVERDIRASNEYIIEEQRKADTERHEIDSQIVKELGERYKEMDKELHLKITQDVSQRTGLEKCLEKKIKPAYKFLLKGDALISPSKGDAEPESILDSKKVQNIYLISGHGSEEVEPFEKRQVMPEDKVLIIFPVCSRPNFLDKICTFIKELKDPQYNHLFRNPIKYRRKITKLINQPIRVYLPGESVPNISTNLFLDFVKENTVLAKSGVYRIQNIPEIERTLLPEAQRKEENLGSPLCLPLSGVIPKPSAYTSKIHREVFSGNIYKAAAQRDTFENLKQRTFNVMDIMKEVGPGIYYYIGCRSSHQAIKVEKYLEILEASEKQQEETSRTKKISPVLKKIRGHKSQSSAPSPSPSSSQPQSSTKESSKSSKEKPKDKKPREPDNNKEERLILKRIYEEIENTIQTFNNVPAKIKHWTEELEPIAQTRRYAKVAQALKLIEEIYDSRKSATDELKVSVDGAFQRLDLVSTLTIEGRRRSFNRRVYGYIPSKMTNRNIKCSTNILIARIKKLYRKGIVLYILPNTKEEWTNKELIFENICQVVAKKLVD